MNEKKQKLSEEKKIPKLKKEPNKLGDDFVAPDGGWGWMIIVACGLSNLCIMLVYQNFGLIFRERFKQLGLTSSEITTIMNINMSATAFLGLANGPMFRRFSFRQVALVGGILCSLATMSLSMTTTFSQILICMAIFHSTGMGISTSASALALNTYFKKKRRIAVGLSWTCTGLGPIIMPQVITLLMPKFGVSGTVLILGAFSLHAIACALIFQPVSWHAKKLSVMDEIRAEAKKDTEAEIFNTTETKNRILSSIENIFAPKLDKFSNLTASRQGFGSQFLFYDDEEEGATGIDVISSENSMLSRTNDGWFSSTHKNLKSENSQVFRRRMSSVSKPPNLLAINKANSMMNINIFSSMKETEDKDRKISYQAILQEPLEIIEKSCEDLKTDINDDLKSEHEKLKSKVDFSEDLEVVEEKSQSMILKWANAICIFFDLNLLKDYVFVNLIIGTTLATFVEVNFAMLTPFILAEYGLATPQIATVMSLLAAIDVIVRLLIPFIASKIGWANRTFFLIGIGCMATGRIVIAHVSNYEIIILVSLLIGFGKGLRTIFLALVIPTHVPLSRLPAASGLQLVTSGITYMALGPVVGWIRDTYGNFTILLHVLNILTYFTILSWSVEAWFTSRRNKQKNSTLGKRVDP